MHERTIRSLTTLLMIAALFAAPALAERIERDYHESFDVQPGARLNLVHGDGDVTVTPWEKDVVDVQVRYRAEIKGVGASRKGEFEVDFQQSGSRIRVVGREPSFAGIGFFSFNEDEYTYKIQAPAYVELHLEGDDGDATIEGWRASIEATLEDGDLQLDDLDADRFDLKLDDGDVMIQGLTGELLVRTEDGDVEVRDCRSPRAEVHTDDGDISVKRCTGDLEVRSSDGEILLGQIRAGTVNVETDDGDIDLELVEARRLDLTVITQDGTVDVTAPKDLSAQLDVATGDGRIRVDFPGVEMSTNRRRASGTLGDGEGRVRITTDDGNVTVREQG